MTLPHLNTSAARAALGEMLDPYPEHRWADVHARAAWSALTEPGDGVAGALIAALGPAAALEFALAPTGDTPAAATGLSPDDVRQGRARWHPRRDAISTALATAGRARVHLVTPEHPEWPTRLDDLGVHRPVCLWVDGAPETLAAPAAVAMVGCRAATSYGVQMVADLSDGCVRAGMTIVSGAAYGIDGAAHEATLRAGGTTIAVLAGGADRPYPAGHRALIERIAHTGAVVAESPCGTAPSKWRFLARNRIIAALSDATVVAEAGWRSGAINTAHHTLALGRPLGAVPGPVTSAASAGCHRLMRELAAVCITSASDVQELIGWSADGRLDAGEFTGERTRILDALDTRHGRDVLDVARRAGFSVDETAVLLGFLELDGRVIRDADLWRRQS